MKPLPDPYVDLYSLPRNLTDRRVTAVLLSQVEVLRLNNPSLSIIHLNGLKGNDAVLQQNDGTPLKTTADAVSEGFFELFNSYISPLHWIR